MVKLANVDVESPPVPCRSWCSGGGVWLPWLLPTLVSLRASLTYREWRSDPGPIGAPWLFAATFRVATFPVTSKHLYNGDFW
jgi:hypothetical protein